MIDAAEIVPLSDGSGRRRDGPAAVVLNGMFEDDPERRSYYDLLAEIRPFLSVGTVEVFGKHEERRMTAFFSTDNCPMQYSGRELAPQKPVPGGQIDTLFRAFAMDEMKDTFRDLIDGVPIELPKFNAVFVNWYRPPAEIPEGKKPDGLGWHADDERSHNSDIIMSMTYTEQNGERVFQMRPKTATSGFTWQSELQHQSILLMLPGCQDAFKHRVSDRKTNLAKKLITGGRINLTFRALKTQ